MASSDRCYVCGAEPHSFHEPDCINATDPQRGGKLVVAGIGDVKSDARGSGARFNGGKTPLELIPTWIIAAVCTGLLPDPGRQSPVKDFGRYEARQVLDELGAWQRNDGVSALQVLQAFEADWVADCAAVFDYGRKKYAEWNWAKGMPWSVPMACAVRHCLAILRGEESDPESHLPHRGHVACNVVMLAQYESSYPEGDDRPWRLLASTSKLSA